MISRIYSILFFLSVALSVWQCGAGNKTDHTGDRLLAKVYNKSLYLSEVPDVVPEGATPQDSSLIMSAYVQRWMRDQLLMYEAERNIPKDLNIDDLVRDYRASLVRFNFEEKIIAEHLDSTVSDAETRQYFEENKEQFQLESTILKAQVLIVPASAPQNELNKLWNSRKAEDEEKLRKFAKQWASLAMLDKEKWYKIEEVAALLPQGTLTAENAASRKEGILSDGDSRYYYRVTEVVRGKEAAPYDYAKEQAQKIIQHRRKQTMLEQWKEDLYQKELRRENVKVY